MINSDAPDFILEVRFYQSDTGTEPVRDWLRSLPKKYRKVIGEDIKTVQYGWPVGMPVVRKIDKGIWEVRSNVKGGIVRVLFTTDAGTMILIHGFVKKSQKISKADLEVARRRIKNLQRGDT